MHSIVRVLGIALAIVAFGCGSDGPGDQTRFLSIGTAPPGGAFFVVGGALADVLTSARQADGWRVTAEATKGSQENIRRLTQGELELALSNSAITYFAVRGEEGWDPQPIRAVMTLAPNVALFVAPESSGIEAIGDLAGRRVVVGPAGAGFQHFVRPILAAHGVAWDEIEVLHATQAGAVDLLADGAADAAFLGGAVPTASITQAAAGQTIRFLPFEARDELVARYPFFRPATIPAGTYPGQEAPFEGLDVGSMHLVTRAGTDEELVYRITRSLWEHRAEVVERHPAGRAINPENATRDTGTEFHPGAVRFFREAGLWPG